MHTFIIEFCNVGPDTTETVQQPADKIANLAQPGVMRGIWRNIEDFLTIDPVPKLARVATWLADKAVEHASARIAAPQMENRSGVIVGTRPGEEIGTVQHPEEPPSLTEIGSGVRQIVSSAPVRQLIKDTFGIDNLEVHPIQGMWVKKSEPSFVLYGDNMSFEAANELSKLLGWAFNQATTVAIMPLSWTQGGTSGRLFAR
jgi:hypothetical protein